MKLEFGFAPRLLAAACALTLVMAFSSRQLEAAGPPSGGFLYVVQYGDTLSSIAARFGVSPQAIMQANTGMYHTAYVGQQMYLPLGTRYGYAPTNYGTSTVYIVQPGDTLFGIAQRFGVSPSVLMRLNYIFNPNIIFAGMSLRVPKINSVPQSYQTYVIRLGDTLSAIAVRFGTTVYALMIANNIPNANLIFAGMRLVVPMSLSAPPTNGTYNYPQMQMPAPTTAPVVPPATPVPGNAMVSMQNLSFNPKIITVRVGTTVVWRNNEPSAIPHTVTSGTPGSPNGTFDSGTMNPGQSFQFTFNSAGTFAYYCRIHGAMMTGTVIVTP